MKRFESCVPVALAAVLMIAAMAILSPSPLNSQTFYGSVVGTVTDSSGAVVPGAKVTVTDIGTNEKQSAQTDATGKFSFVNLVPADYSVEVTKANFKRFIREHVPVQVGAVVRIDSALAIGNVSETVEVSTAAPLLQTDTSSLNTEIEGDQVQQTPLNGRNVMNLIALAPGVIPTAGAMGDTGLDQTTRTGGGGQWNSYEIGGAIQGQSGSYIDGVPNNVLGGNAVALVPTQDAIQEFNVASSNATADFGRFAGGVVNMTTRSGSNSFHGSAWEYFRNADLNANDFFSNEVGSARPQWNQNQYGAIASGPIKRNKMFFMGAWESFAALTGLVNETNVPTAGMQSGIIPEVYSGSTLLNSSVVDPLGNCTITHQAGTPGTPGTWTITNLYQGSCGDPLNQILKTYYPAPNSHLSGSNWFLTTPLTNHQYQFNGRGDYTISSKQRLFSRYTYWHLQDGAHSEFLEKGFNGTTWPTNDGHEGYQTHQAVVGDTYTLNPTTVLDVRVEYVRETGPNLPASTSVNESQFGSAYAALSPQMSVHTSPGYSASGVHGLYSLGNFPGYFISWWNTYGVNANLTKIIGAHSLKFGTELRLMDASTTGSTGAGAGSYTYSQTYSNTSGVSNTGDEWASFLMGYPTAVTFTTIAKTAGYMYYQAYYATDSWQATRNLTLNFGLRYELPGADAERNNKATVLLPNALDPYTGITGTLSLVNSPLYGGRTTVAPKYNLFAPRVGFAFHTHENTVVRGGYGISFLPNDLSGESPSGSVINAASTTTNIAGALPTPLQSVLQGIVATGLKQPIGRNVPSFMTLYGSTTKYLAQAISGTVPVQPYPWVQQWNFDLSHQFKGDWMAEIGYSGLKGLNLPGAGKVLDQLPDSFDSMGSALLGNAACANANGETMTVGQCLRPLPYYNKVSDTAQFYARSNYSSVQAKAEKRFGSAGVLTANYTWSKNMANTDTSGGGGEKQATAMGAGGSGSGKIQDYTNLGAEYSLLSYDVTNRMIVSYVLPLPFGKGQKYGNNLNGAVNELASGWAVNGVTTLQSGFPLYFTTASNTLANSFGAGTIRPNVVPGCNKVIGGSGLARAQAGAWFNISCFVSPANYTFGNEPRLDSTLRADGIKNFDFSFQKSTAFYESANLEFRAEFFNIFNRVQFAPPITTANAGNFGQEIYQVNKPRQIQLSLRVNF